MMKDEDHDVRRRVAMIIDRAGVGAMMKGLYGMIKNKIRMGIARRMKKEKNKPTKKGM